MSESVIFWGTPKKARPQAEHNETYVFDDGPPGGYVPNMSQDDARRWRGKFIKRGAHPRVEIRKTCSKGGTQMLIIVSNEGGYQQGSDKYNDGVNVRISMNGPSKLTYQEWDEMQQAIQEAREMLKQG